MTDRPEIANDPMYAATFPRDGLGGLFVKLSDKRWYHVYIIDGYIRFQEVD